MAWAEGRGGLSARPSSDPFATTSDASNPRSSIGADRSHVRGLRRFRRAWLAVFAALLLPTSALGVNLTFTVNSTTDAVDAAPGNGVCATTGGACTLRAAIQEANAHPNSGSGTDTISIPTAGTYRLTITGRDEEAAAKGDLDITEAVVITG